MCADLSCVAVSLTFLIAGYYKLEALAKELIQTKESLSALIYEVVSHRNRLSRMWVMGGWERIDREIFLARSALEKAKILLDGTDETDNRVRLRMGGVGLVLKYGDAKAERDRLSECEESLMAILVELVQMNARYSGAGETYFREAQQKVVAAFIEHFRTIH
ncbi:MAG: hypothetical protein M1813_004979 [Trichoglossum hirsutum]|jgi:hypothetical protein|nr:MAG: hypothetical protein M1813_004979 [Trichoglossum hirsutum]